LSITGRTVLITGGNTGIGKAAAIELARQGARVVITARNEDKGKAALREIAEKSGREADCLHLDLASFESVRSCASKFVELHTELYVLINNAGLILSERAETVEGFEMTVGVNHLGHFLLTSLLKDMLVSSAPARIVTVSSDAHRRAIGGLDFDDLQSMRRYDPLLTYGRTKLMNILFTRELARRLEGTSVTANAVHPGVVATEFALDGDARGFLSLFYSVFKPFLRSPERGADTIVHLATAPELSDVTGAYFVNRRVRPPSGEARDDVAAARLWELSEQWIAQGHP
jgi:NAD(P)-dependent dehydrogenase (short-subunit alcohol dehydrogenase family)